MYDTQSFRSSILGFDRNDVINYIETLTREHQEEIDAFRAAAETLRGERDEARRKIEGQESQIEHLREDSGAMERLSREAEAGHAAATEAAARLVRAEDALRRSENEMIVLRQQNEELTKQNEEINKAKLKAADMEIMAYKRAQEIEDEALRNAEKARAALNRLIRDAKGKYSVAKGDMEAAAYNAMQQLDSMRGWLDSFPRLFDDIDSELDGVIAAEHKAPGHGAHDQTAGAPQ
ncbi:MAG: hypothetical protein FWH06_00495 [Oscillospiraceae bacterium]|nr:hypothetical protein [Oscillospiraceae bacterium]